MNMGPGRRSVSVRPSFKSNLQLNDYFVAGVHLELNVIFFLIIHFLDIKKITMGF